MSINTQTLLQSIADPRRRRAILERQSDEDLEDLQTHYESWGPAFPSGVTRARECEAELQRRRELAAEGA
jgi:hypothetical protein